LFATAQVDVGARQASKGGDVVRSRKGVVKMLIASVSVYVISYAPAQIPLFYNVMSPTPFRVNWPSHLTVQGGNPYLPAQ